MLSPFFVFSYAILNSYADYRCNFGPRLINFGKKTVIWIICGSQEDLEVENADNITRQNQGKSGLMFISTVQMLSDPKFTSVIPQII